MSEEPREKLDTLVHDVNSKCASLKTAVMLLKAAPPNEARKLLGLMGKQARSIAQDIETFAKVLPSA